MSPMSKVWRIRLPRVHCILDRRPSHQTFFFWVPQTATSTGLHSTVLHCLYTYGICAWLLDLSCFTLLTCLGSARLFFVLVMEKLSFKYTLGKPEPTEDVKPRQPFGGTRVLWGKLQLQQIHASKISNPWMWRTWKGCNKTETKNLLSLQGILARSIQKHPESIQTHTNLRELSHRTWRNSSLN